MDLGRRAIYFHRSGEKGHLFSWIWGEGSFIFKDLGRRAIYFHGSGEKGHLFSGIWGQSNSFEGLRRREQGS